MEVKVANFLHLITIVLHFLIKICFILKEFSLIITIIFEENNVHFCAIHSCFMFINLL